MMSIITLALFCCIAIPPINDDSVHLYNVIFIGEVTEVNDLSRIYCKWFDCPRYTFKVVKAYKGVKKGQLININSSFTSIGIHTNVGRRWLIAINQNCTDNYTIGVCGQSARINGHKAIKNLEYLNSSDFECKQNSIDSTYASNR